MDTSFAQGTLRSLQPDDAGYAPMLTAASAPLRREFGDAVEVRVERLDQLGNWAFLMGTMQAPGGGRPGYAGSRFAERAASGGMSDVYVALLKRRSSSGDDSEDAPGEAGADQGVERNIGEWTLAEHAIGPGDVAWLAWPDRHSAPKAVFGF